MPRHEPPAGPALLPWLFWVAGSSQRCGQSYPELTSSTTAPYFGSLEPCEIWVSAHFGGASLRERLTVLNYTTVSSMNAVPVLTLWPKLPTRQGLEHRLADDISLGRARRPLVSFDVCRHGDV